MIRRLLKKDHRDHKGRSISVYSGYSEGDSLCSSSSTIIKNKGDPRLRHRKQETLLQHIRNKTKRNLLLGFHHSMSRIVQTFETELEASATISILTKPKLVTENPLVGKAGHLITANNKTLAVLLSPVESAFSTNRCCGYEPNENDPMNYYVVSPSGDELMSVSGLDESNDTESTVYVTLSSLRTPIGSISYNKLGADGKTLSKVTVMAGRSRSYAVPTSVLSSGGEMLYIFRRDRHDDFAYTELLSADGKAITVAEIIINYKDKTNHNQNDRVKPTSSFDVNFLGITQGRDRALILGISVTIFNQWLTRQNRKKTCCSIV